MNTDSGSMSSTDEVPARADRREGLIWGLMWAGLVAAVVGLVDGISMALDKKEAMCPDGKFFPEGTTDFTCYVHPDADIGIAVASISVVLGILVVLATIIARAHLAGARAGD